MLKKMSFRRKKNCWRQDFKKWEYVEGITEAAGITAIIAGLFYQSVTAGIILFVPISAFYLHIWEQEKTRKKKRDFTVQFLDALQSLSAALNVGYSLENAMIEANKELKVLYRKEDRIRKEWDYMIRQMKMNIGLEQIMEELSARIEQEDVQNFVTVLASVKKSGGNVAKVVRQTMRQIQEKEDVNREIETMIAAKKMEFLVMAIVPFGMIGYMEIGFPDFVEHLYKGMAGRCVMSICLAGYLAAFRIGMKIIRIEV